MSSRARRRRKPAATPWSWLAAEIGALAFASLVAVMAGVGRAASRFTGTGLVASLMPFAATVLVLVLLLTAAALVWLAARRRVRRVRAWLPAAAALALAAGAAAWATTPSFEADLTSLRALLGARHQAERDTVAHQVFAHYRRTAPAAWQALLERVHPFESQIHLAARAFGVEAEVLIGIAAAESGFQPRPSRDGGRGLFQITAPPAGAVAAVRAALASEEVDVERDSAFFGAATLRAYLDEMNGDLFLALLAYNIGPNNGGLSSIMRQYGARDFVTIQPYLQNLPRDYPVRVLAAALAYRLWKREGSLPRYEEGENASRIQRLGVPGL